MDERWKIPMRMRLISDATVMFKKTLSVISFGNAQGDEKSS